MSEPKVIRVEDPLPAVLPKHRKGLEIAEFDTELVVLETESNRAHHLQGLAAIVFDACDGRTRSDQLVRQVAEAMGIDEPEAHRQVADLWRTFVRIRLLRD
ncbi:MAG: hypothetical protein RI900_2710 [Actinomycetota bacterium]|jgi:Coenzyme PQQ synthesis protein D (PqqD)